MNTCGFRAVVAITAMLWCVGSSLGVDIVQQDRTPRNGAEAEFFAEYTDVVAYRAGSGAITSLFGPDLSKGGSATDNAVWFMLRHAPMFRAEFAELKNHSLLEDARATQPVMYDPGTGEYRFTLVYFAQERAGIPVFRGEARLLARNEPGNPIVLVRSALRDVRSFKLAPGYEQRLVGQDALHDATLLAGPDFVNFGGTRLVIWAGVDDQVVAPRLAFEFTADNGLANTPRHAERLFVVDAFDGQLLHHESLVHELDITGVARGNATNSFRADLCDPEVPTGLPYLNVTLGATTVTADAAGAFTIPTSDAGPFTLSASVIGRYFRVNDSATPVEALSVNIGAGEAADFLFNAANTSEFRRAEMNAYVNINRSRDLVLAANPAYPTIAGQLNFNVYVNEAGSCNAFYNSNTVRFFRSGGGCANMTIPTVVAHEYGHHLVATGGSGQQAYGEGMGDTLGVLLSDDPISGAGYNMNCATGGRSAANNVNYPCSGAIHTCGTLLSGCVWNTRNAMVSAGVANYREVLGAITVNSVLLHTGTSITPEITADFLTLDDDDGNIFNGTPNYASIAAGFSSHNMAPPAGVDAIGVLFPDGRPVLLSSRDTTPVRVIVRRNTSDPRPVAVTLSHVSGGEATTVPMVEGAPNDYYGTLPSAVCGRIVRYWVTATPSDGVGYTAPSNAPVSTYTAVSASASVRVFADECEGDSGWRLSSPSDTATAGRWVRGDPVGTTSQSDFDHTPGTGTNCYYTGAGTADVDGGTTTLTSPMFSLAGVRSPTISYWRWYSNRLPPAPGLDVFVVEISNDDGTTWHHVETVGSAASDARGGWIQHEFDPSPIVELSGLMKLRFTASDLNADSTIEAAIDDFLVQGYSCPACPTDWNNDGVNNTADFFAFLMDFFDGNADYNASGQTDSQDFFGFFDDFGRSCD